MELLTFVFYFFLIIWYVAVITFIIYLYRHNYKPYSSKFQGSYYESLPSELEPGELSMLLYRKIEPQLFSTTILSLIKKGVLELQFIDQEYHFKIVHNVSGRVKLTRAETVIRDFLLSVAHMGKFSLTDLSQYCGTKKGDTEFLFQFELWKKVLRKESSQKHFYEEKKGYRLMKLLKNLGIVLLIVNFVGGYHLFTGYSTLLPVLFLPFFFSIIYKRTEEYNEEYEKWLAFGNYLSHLKEFAVPTDINQFTMSAIVLKKIDALHIYKPDDKSIAFASKLSQTMLKCYRHAYLNGNRSITNLWNSK